MFNIDASMLSKGLLVESWHVELSEYIIDLAWSPDASKLAVATVEGQVYMVDHGNSAQSRLIGCHEFGVNSLSWRADGAEFSTAGHDGLVKIWDGDSGQELASLEAGDRWVAKSVYHPRRNVLAAAAGRQLKLWNEQHEVFYESSDHSSTIADVSWHPRGLGIAAVANRGLTLHLSDETAEPRKYRWRGSSLVLKWSPDARFIVTGEQDASIHFWFMESGKDAQIRGYPSKVLNLSWDSSCQLLATGGGPTIVVWDCSGEGPVGRQPRQLEAHSNKLTELVFQSDGSLLASADADSFLFLWEPCKHEKVVGGVLLSSPASCMQWCTGGKIAVGQQDGNVVVFEVESRSRKNLGNGP